MKTFGRGYFVPLPLPPYIRYVVKLIEEMMYVVQFLFLVEAFCLSLMLSSTKGERGYLENKNNRTNNVLIINFHSLQFCLQLCTKKPKIAKVVDDEDKYIINLPILILQICSLTLLQMKALAQHKKPQLKKSNLDYGITCMNRINQLFKKKNFLNNPLHL